MFPSSLTEELQLPMPAASGDKYLAFPPDQAFELVKLPNTSPEQLEEEAALPTANVSAVREKVLGGIKVGVDRVTAVLSAWKS